MELTIKFTLDDSWEAYHATDEQRLKALLRDNLDGVKTEVVKPTSNDTFVRKNNFGEVHIAPDDIYPCSICKYKESNSVKECASCGNYQEYYKK